MNKSSIYSCFDNPSSQDPNCQWRDIITFSPLLLFWIFLPVIHWKLRRVTGVYEPAYYRNILQSAVLIILAIYSLLCIFAEDFSPLWISARVLAAVTYVGLSVSIQLHAAKKQLISAAIFISITVLCYSKFVLSVVKVTENNWDYKTLIEFILLMAESALLSSSDNKTKDQTKSPEQLCSWFSKLLFSWMTPLVVTSSRQHLTRDDLYVLRDDCQAASLLQRWDIEWEKEKRKQQARNEISQKAEPASIIRPFVRTQKNTLITSTVCRFLADVIHYVNPMLLKELIDFISQPIGNVSYAIGLACFMFFSAEIRSFLLNYQVYIMFRLTILYNSILSMEIMRKTLRLSPKSRAKMTSGEILNMAAVDVEKLTSCIQLIQNVWSIPLQVTLAMMLLWFMMGPAAIPGTFLLLLFAPLNYYTSVYIKKAQLKQMKIKDERTKMCAEVLNGIKVIKLYAWEGTFEERINHLREKEVKYLKKIQLTGRMVDAANAVAPFLVAISSFTCFLWLYGSQALTPAVAFVSLAIFNQIRQPMRLLGLLTNSFVQSMVSNKRIKTFLNMEELNEHAIDSDARGHAVVMSNAFSNWEGPSFPPLLKKIDLIVDPGQLIAVVGQVGSGKSSLLNSILGELHKCSGTIHVDGSIAYVPQQPWIFNKSIRENILYGAIFDKLRYDKIIHACELNVDFRMFDHGDHTEVGENGVNLSGGQKARIELARSLYQDRSIYLLDDPLSAVDAHVGRSVFEKVLGPEGMLKDKTRILVTHNLQYTKEVDQILVMFEGSIVQNGTYKSLKSSPGLFTDLLRENQSEEEEKQHTQTAEPPKRAISRNESVTTDKKCSEAPKLGQEKMQYGQIKTGVYWLYFKSMGIKNTFGFFGFFILHYFFMVLRSIWLSQWSTENTAYKTTNETSITTLERVSVYAGLGILEIIMIIICFAFLLYGTIRSAITLHNPLMAAILRAPITFFDVTPVGQIINRLAKDLEVIDNLGNNFRQFTQSLLHVFMIFFLCSYSIPTFSIFAIPLFGCYLVIVKSFFPAIRQLRRMESVSRSPVLSIFAETLSGASSIRAYGRFDSTCLKLETAIDNLAQCKYLSIATNRWCAARLELLGNSVVLSAAILGTLSAKYFDLSPGLVGLSVSYALSITEVLNIAVRMLGELETNIVSVERIKEYHKITPEDDWEVKNAVDDDWPSKGAITLKDFKMKYREDLPLVLKGVNVEIAAGEKVAIVGRTGSGKSSLTLALFRMIEADSGLLKIDAVEVALIGLHQLRSRMAIIPQDPILFSGSLRFNLDPFDMYTDDQIWSALKKCQLHDFASSNAEKLEFFVAEGGKNMSVGERQLVCLGRALLRGGKIIVLDEATAAVDSTTDALIQKVVREEFQDATVLAIAHRLDTIADYNKILVLDNGEVAEYNTPEILLQDPQSIYSQMVEKFKRY